MVESLLARFLHGDRPALARLITLLDRGRHVDEIRAALADRPGGGMVVAITGNSGVGKSTLIGKLIVQTRSRNRTIAVLACDPQSPITGGALLGDRIRMSSAADDAGVFIRSLAVPSGRQAIASHLDAMIDVLRAFGFDLIVVETVGAGQGDTAIHDVCDLVVLLVQPEAGDDLQWEKAGIVEIADVVVVHKADLPGAEGVAIGLREQLHMPGRPDIPVLQASASKNHGLTPLWDVLESRSRKTVAGA